MVLYREHFNKVFNGEEDAEQVFLFGNDIDRVISEFYREYNLPASVRNQLISMYQNDDASLLSDNIRDKLEAFYFFEERGSSTLTPWGVEKIIASMPLEEQCKELGLQFNVVDLGFLKGSSDSFYLNVLRSNDVPAIKAENDFCSNVVSALLMSMSTLIERTELFNKDPFLKYEINSSDRGGYYLGLAAAVKPALWNSHPSWPIFNQSRKARVKEVDECGEEVQKIFYDNVNEVSEKSFYYFLKLLVDRDTESPPSENFKHYSKIVSALSLQGLKQLTLEMLSCKGSYPDIVYLHEDKLYFTEVKAKKDKLRFEQVGFFYDALKNSRLSNVQMSLTYVN